MIPINTVYSDLLSFDNGLWKVSPNIQYLLELFVISSNNQIMYKLLFILFIIKINLQWTFNNSNCHGNEEIV